MDAAAALRARAQEFYTLLQARQIGRAERYATAATRERFLDQVGSPFLSFEIRSVTLGPDGTSAKVSVDFNVLAGFMGGVMTMTRDSDWRLEEGEWRVVVPERPSSDLQSAMAMGSQEVPKPEELRFEKHRVELEPLKSGETKLARFSFKNGTDHVVKISRVDTGCPCLTVKTQKMEYLPGEAGELVVEFNSTGYEYEYSQTMVVWTQPGDVKSYLTLHTEVIPKAIAAPQGSRPASQY